MRPLETFALLLCVGLATGINWNYNKFDLVNGPANWAADFGSCDGGDVTNFQSPIDISTVDPQPNPNYEDLSLRDQIGQGNVQNNGRFLTIVPAKNTPSPYFSGGAVDGTFTLSAIKLALPSETSVNGKTFDAELQYIHKNGDEQAIISLLLDRGSLTLVDVPNGWLNGLLDALVTTGKDKQQSVNVRFYGALPEDLSYWTFAGSLSYPPCTSDVRWHVLDAVGSISLDQLTALGSVFDIPSARPQQDRKGRIIYFQEDSNASPVPMDGETVLTQPLPEPTYFL